MGREPFPFQMTLVRAHSVRRRRSGVLEKFKKAEEEVGDGERGTVGGEWGTAERLDGGEGLAPEKEGGRPTGEGVGEGMCLIGEGPGDGLYPLHCGDGRTKKEESGIQTALDTDEDSEGAERKGLERDGGVPTHVVRGGRFVFVMFSIYEYIY